jgi:hypothetical protein
MDAWEQHFRAKSRRRADRGVNWQTVGALSAGAATLAGIVFVVLRLANL